MKEAKPTLCCVASLQTFVIVWLKLTRFSFEEIKRELFPIIRSCIAVIKLLCRVFCCSCTVGHTGSSITTLRHTRSAYHCIRFRVVTSGRVKSTVVWNEKSCSLVDRYHCFVGTCCLPRQNRGVLFCHEEREVESWHLLNYTVSYPRIQWVYFLC